jgi:predicted CXXCH cytochrome family protein
MSYLHSFSFGLLIVFQLQLCSASPCESCHKENHRIHSIEARFKDAKRPPHFPLENGRMTCETCHYISSSCKVSGAKVLETGTKEKGPFLLRGGPYPREEDFCLVCHPQFKKLTEPLNPHELKSEADRAKCLVCHKNDPFKTRPTELRPELKLPTDQLCLQCHSKNAHQDSRHGEKTLTDKMLEGVERLRKDFGYRLPVTETKEMSCSTCHNPHISTSILMIKAKIFEHALRMPAENAEVCKACHETVELE